MTITLLLLSSACQVDDGNLGSAASAKLTNPLFPDDFDFLIGEWKVTNQRRMEWLAGSDEWVEFPSTCRFWKVMNGMAVMDECLVEREGQTEIGSSYRIYDSTTRQWTIYWASTAFPHLGLVKQVTGSFANDVGEFLGDEQFQGRTVRLRFLWRSLSPTEALWEQAYAEQGSDAWEVNWKMHFSLVGRLAAARQTGVEQRTPSCDTRQARAPGQD